MAYGKTENYKYGDTWEQYENPMYDYSKGSKKDGDGNPIEKWGRQRLLKTQLRENRWKNHSLSNTSEPTGDIATQKEKLGEYIKNYREATPLSWVD